MLSRTWSFRTIWSTLDCAKILRLGIGVNAGLCMATSQPLCRQQRWPFCFSTGKCSSELQKTVLRCATVESVCWAETKWSRWEHAPLCLHWIWVCRDTQTHHPTHTFQFAHIWSLNYSQALVWCGLLTHRLQVLLGISNYFGILFYLPESTYAALSQL